EGVGCVAAVFHPDGKQVLTAAPGTIARTWDVTTGKERVVFRGHTGPINNLAYSPDDERMVTAADDATVRVWDTATGKALLVLRGHGSRVRSACFSPDGTLIVSGSDDGTARIWNAATGKELATLKTNQRDTTALFVADGQRVLTIGDEVRRWPV